jgi:hypothetical protein
MRHALLVIGSLTLGSCVAAFSGRGSLLKPGSAELNIPRFLPAHFTVRYLTRDSSLSRSEREVARAEVDELPLSESGASGMIIVTVVATANARTAFVDSAVVDRLTLAPRWEVMHSGSTRTRFDYAGPRVTLVRQHADSAPVRAEHMYAMPVFHFNELDLLIRSLPLRVGYHAILPLYSEGSDALEIDTADVIRRDSTGKWEIRFADPAIIATYRIDERERLEVAFDRMLRTNHSWMRRVVER